MNILVVEESRTHANEVVDLIKANGCAASAVYDVPACLASAKGDLFDALVIDAALPEGGAGEIVRELRREGASIPILVLSSLDSTQERIEFLDLGADDYMPRPFQPEELMARLRALVRRRGEVVLEEISFADITLDLTTHDLSCGERSIHLSAKEFQVMYVLMTSSTRVISKQALLAKAWGSVPSTSENSVEAYISFLRKKLSKIGSKVQITTLRMLGYRLEYFED